MSAGRRSHPVARRRRQSIVQCVLRNTLHNNGLATHHLRTTKAGEASVLLLPPPPWLRAFLPHYWCGRLRSGLAPRMEPASMVVHESPALRERLMSRPSTAVEPRSAFVPHVALPYGSSSKPLSEPLLHRRPPVRAAGTAGKRISLRVPHLGSSDLGCSTHRHLGPSRPGTAPVYGRRPRRNLPRPRLELVGAEERRAG